MGKTFDKNVFQIRSVELQIKTHNFLVTSQGLMVVFTSLALSDKISTFIFREKTDLWAFSLSVFCCETLSAAKILHMCKLSPSATFYIISNQ